MHQTGAIGHLTGGKWGFFARTTMILLSRREKWRRRQEHRLMALLVLGVLAFAVSPLLAQSSGNQGQSQQPANSQPAQEIPDAPSTVQPPAPKLPTEMPPEPGTSAPPAYPGEAGQQPNQEKQAAPPMPPIETIPPGSRPRNQINPKQDLYTISVSANVVQIPVLVQYSEGRRVDGLLSKDFVVKENGKVQTLTYFSSDPFELSVAVLLDTGIADVALQKVNQSYGSLVGAFSPYDEVALYTYSSTVTQVTDYTGRPEKLTAALNQMKLVRGRNNGPPVLGGPLGPQGPTVNGAPVGGPIIQPVNTPPREAHVLNDAILRAAQDLTRRDRTRRKVIFVISDGRELGSKASYKDVLKVLETRDIQVKAVVLDSGALPIYRQLDKLHLMRQGYSNILPKYVWATCGGQVYSELSRNAIEDAYAEIASEARNQYTLGYVPKPTTGSSPYRSIEVIVDKKDLKVSAKDGYYS